MRKRPGKPFKIGLTGGIGSGKSLVLRFLKERGVSVLQTDLVGHQLLQEKKFSKRLLKFFGNNILGKNGRIDRKKLAQEVFGDWKKQKKLNELSHPTIRKRVSDWVGFQARKSTSPPMIVVEVPLLFEGGYYRWFDGTLSISAPRMLRQKRLLKRGWNPLEIRRREKSQWPQSRKNRMANWVIINQGTQKELRYAVNHWLEKIQRSVAEPRF